MSVRTAGDVTIEETDRGDFAVVINNVEIAYADTQFEAESFKTFLNAFSVSFTAATSIVAYIQEVRGARKLRELARPHIDAHSELIEPRGATAPNDLEPS